ncbi:MAG TPA: haloalkane dehalogenase [Myxococcota bacterium]|nr:haloalkane dehalogenase [Myxococcota bacterium]
MQVLRTPDDRFADLAGYPFPPRYATVSDPDGGTVRMHYVDEGPRDGPPVLMCHGNPDWSYSFRGLIRHFAEAGYRAIAPDMLGFGRSDKPVDPRAHSIERHVDWLRELVVGLDLRDATLVCQDWGSTMGCGVVALEPDRFARILVANGILHTAESELAGRFPPGYSVHALNDREVCVGAEMLAWLARSQRMPGLKASQSVSGLCREKAAPEVHAGYDAPFPDEEHMVAVRQFAMLIPLRPGDEGAVLNRRTWQVLGAFERPLLTVYGDSDPCTGGWGEIFQERVPGAKGQPHVVLEGAGHFLGEDRPDDFARYALEFVQST